MPDFALSPLTYALALALLLALSWLHLQRWVRFTGVVLEILLLLTITPVGANSLVWIVESRVPAIACAAPHPAAIVVLSGGIDSRPRSSEDYVALDAASVQRLLAAVALWRNQMTARLVIAGGGQRVSEAVLMAGLAERLGVPKSAIELDTDSRTTWENAKDVSRLSPAVPKRIWLVSSALHLPRAMQAFRAWGFQPCAWPSGSSYVPFKASFGYFFPQASALVKADQAIHELLGGWLYAWRARSKHSNKSR